jgi:nitroreductase
VTGQSRNYKFNKEGNMDFYQVLEGRSSIRAFLPKPVDEGLLEKILLAAGYSPSYMNTQPWEVFVVMGKKKEELCAGLSLAAQEDEPKRPDFPLPTAWPEALEKRLSAHRRNRFAALRVDTSDQKKLRAGYLRNFQLYGAPCGVFVGLDQTLTSWSMFDSGLFVHGFLMALHAEGLGGCPQAMLTIYPDIIRKHLRIPDNIKIAMGISVGYPDYDSPLNSYRSQRKDINEFVRWFD